MKREMVIVEPDSELALTACDTLGAPAGVSAARDLFEHCFQKLNIILLPFALKHAAPFKPLVLSESATAWLAKKTKCDGHC